MSDLIGFLYFFSNILSEIVDMKFYFICEISLKDSQLPKDSIGLFVRVLMYFHDKYYCRVQNYFVVNLHSNATRT